VFRDLMQNSPLLAFPLAALALFVTTFGAIVARTMSKHRAAEFEAAARLPLATEEARHG
jgi:hypothetical protein